ncbi:hypothetical protein MKW94_030274, partial [Papaver nudicaule]|nr:hypothetical protein [Papaver nudicaule]
MKESLGDDSSSLSEIRVPSSSQVHLRCVHLNRVLMITLLYWDVVIVQNENQIEVSFTRNWDSSLTGKVMPVNIDKRYVILKDSSGFYTYAIFNRLKGWPEFSIGEARIAFKLSQALAYLEAVLLTDTVNPAHKGEVDDKYMYSTENKDTGVHGWISSNSGVGLWMITASNEFRTGGPLKQDLTSHAGLISLAMFISSHYSGEDLAPKFQNGESWKKVFGYVNSAPAAKKGCLYSTLGGRKSSGFILGKEIKSWPYSFPASDDFPASNQRGTVTGSLLVRDRYVNQRDVAGSSAYVGLAPPGDVGSWQKECKGYQFWTKANADGSFSIPNVRAGEYNLFAWVPGFIGDFKHTISIKIAPGFQFSLLLVYEPPRAGPTLWEISFLGSADLKNALISSVYLANDLSFILIANSSGSSFIVFSKALD